MNQLDSYVTEIKGEPELRFGKWFLPVVADCYGRPMDSDLMFDTEDEAKAVVVGHHFLTWC